MKSVILSEAAAREVRRLLQRGQGQPGLDNSPPRIRLAVRAGGCKGYFYDLGPAAASGPEDRAFASRGVAVAIDPESYVCLADTDLTIDYTEDLVGGAFRFEATGGPQRQHCDCGLSFRQTDCEQT